MCCHACQLERKKGLMPQGLAGDTRGVVSALQEFATHVQHARVVADPEQPPLQRSAIHGGAQARTVDQQRQAIHSPLRKVVHGHRVSSGPALSTLGM